MNHSDSTRVVRRAWPRPAGTTAAAIATTVLALLAVAYSACVRSHGVPNYPDPGSDGNLPKGSVQAFGVSNSQHQAAQRACRHLLPNSDTRFAAVLTRLCALERTRCRRSTSHGHPR